jgi:hypothetical protein
MIQSHAQDIQWNMKRMTRWHLCAFLFVFGILSPNLFAQQDQESEEESLYGTRFFDQLRNIFGKFRDMDLQRVFQEAKPIECPELVGRKGEWRSVAFFNEDRRLGDWCRERLAEVKADLAIYTFKGDCREGQDKLQVTTEFPTTESIESYNQHRIDLDQVDITVNDPVLITRDPATRAYTFDLPYLFLTGQNGETKTYSFIAPNRNSTYAAEVTGRWECKLVAAKDVTYRFLICRTRTVPRGRAARQREWEPSFGSSAFFILSDGMEAQSSVRVLSGNDAQEPADKILVPSSPTRPYLKRDTQSKPPGN